MSAARHCPNRAQLCTPQEVASSGWVRPPSLLVPRNSTLVICTILICVKLPTRYNNQFYVIYRYPILIYYYLQVRKQNLTMKIELIKIIIYKI